MKEEEEEKKWKNNLVWRKPKSPCSLVALFPLLMHCMSPSIPHPTPLKKNLA